MISSAALAKHLIYDKTTIEISPSSPGVFTPDGLGFYLNGHIYGLAQAAVYLHTGRWYDRVIMRRTDIEHIYALNNLKWRYL